MDIDNPNEEDIKLGLVYAAIDGPNRVEIAPGYETFEVVCKVSMDDGKTVEEKEFCLATFELATDFMEQINKAADPVVLRFLDHDEEEDSGDGSGEYVQ